jgi:uncharacterized damage-inducible protein DinB
MNELARALIGSSAFAPAGNIVQGLSDAEALEKPIASRGAAPRCIYEEIWHMAYWQEISLDWVQGKPTPYPEHASEGFPSNFDEPWEKLRSRFLAGTQTAAAIANDTDRLEVTVACPTNPERNRPADMTVREQLESLAAHNAYHLGRVVLLRQLLGNWPPPDGGDSW